MHDPKFNAKQSEALKYLSPSSPVEQVLYGGGVFGGKTWLGCYWQIARRIKYPKTRGLIGRAELKRLQLSTMLRFWEICAEIGLKPDVHYTYNGQLNMITWFNGSETLLMDMADKPSDPEFQRFGSFEITDYFIDEVAEISKKSFDIIDSRTRYNLIGGVPKGLLTCNPSHNFTYTEFYKASKKDELPPHRAFVEALLHDNTIKPDPIYQAKIMRLPEADRKRLLEGDWDYDESIDRLFNYDDITRCFRDELIPGEKYITADIARMGKDRTVLCYWEGMTLREIKSFRKMRVDEVVQEVRKMISDKGVNLRNVIADEDGVGGGVVDSVKCRGFLNGSRSTKPDRYQHLKAECYFKLAEVIESNGITFHIREEKETILKELDVIRRRNPEGDGKLNVTGKEEISRTHGFSPDIADAIMMRMFFILRPNYGKYNWA
jgi:phage terminase large subunit